MGSSESTLSSTTTRTTTTMNEDINENNNSAAGTGTRTRPRRRHHSVNETRTEIAETSVAINRGSHTIAADDPWWWEIENENLTLDHVPNVTAVYSESESVPTTTTATSSFSHDFNRLLKIGENNNLTLIGGENQNKNNNNNNNNGKSNDEENETTTTARTKCLDTISEKTETNTTESERDIFADSNYSLSCVVAREQSLEEFKEELRVKRLARQTAVQDLRDEIVTLRKQLATEKALTRTLRQSDGNASGEGIATLDDTINASSNVQPVQPVLTEVDDGDDTDPTSRSRHANIELANAQLALQLANADNISLRTELGVIQKQVGTLKEVIACCKQMLSVKEEQCDQLKTKLQEIETSFSEREMKIMSNNLRQEYERQLGNIRQLRQLYEERQRVAAAEHENLQRLMSIKKDELIAEQEKTKNFEERNQTLLNEVESANKELAILREECNEHKFEKKALKEEMGAVNTLFSQMVMGFNGKNNLDIDRLTTMLEENRTLLNDMATREINCSDGATLPKLLFELVEQASIVDFKAGHSNSSRSVTPTPPTCDDDDETARNDDETDSARNETVLLTNSGSEQQTSIESELDGIKEATHCAGVDDKECYGNDTTANGNKCHLYKKYHRKNSANKSKCVTAATLATTASNAVMLKCYEPEVMGKVASAQEIIGNLPKVWKVLMELLSHHKIEQVKFEEGGAGEDCYKSVETATGPKTELSVSKTYIKLKDLILEKKSLVKETNRLKTLNSHLDYRLNEQEKRLSAVSLELTKTWHLVGKMQRQHRQLHTQEQILRYQLQQKRRLLSELKDELEYCRRKWAAARAKNDESQEQCNDLRREFAKRKLEDANHSAESGYSDSGPQSDEEERGGGADVGGVAVAAAAVTSGNCRRKHLKEMFEHTRKIKRMQSTSPGRAAATANNMQSEEIVLRWNSAPPTCGWRGEDDDDDDDDDDNNDADDINVVVLQRSGNGAIPKTSAHCSRSKYRSGTNGAVLDVRSANLTDLELTDDCAPVEQRAERASRILRLEEQCKSLIQQVLETSDNRERLEVQLCRFQDEIAPVQYAVPLEEFINRKRIERTTRASSAPVTGTLTPREEEYTRKRSERLGRLEEESRQLMSRIKRTSDRGHYLRCSLDRIRRAPSREGSFESNTEEESSSKEEKANSTNTLKSPLTADEEAYTSRRAARLKRLEEESRQLLTTLSRNTQRGEGISNKLDALHERYNGEEVVSQSDLPPAQEQPTVSTPFTVEQRLENIEKVSANREARLRILEEEGKELLTRLTNTSERGTKMINRISERELNRQAASIKAATADPSTIKDDGTVPDDGVGMPTLKNVACSSIVGEELTECVTVTTTPSRIATQQGAIPKTKPLAQLSASSRQKKSSTQPCPPVSSTSMNAESLEEMVRRLREIPFPSSVEIPAENAERPISSKQIDELNEEKNEMLLNVAEKEENNERGEAEGDEEKNEKEETEMKEDENAMPKTVD